MSIKENLPEITQKPKKSKIGWIIGCFGLIIIILVILFGLKSMSSFDNFSDIPIPTDETKESTSTKGGIKPYSPMEKEELVEYLATVTTNYGSNTVKLSKWNKDIKVQFKGTPTQEFEVLIDEFIAKFNKNSNTVKMQKVTSGGNYTVEFGDTTSGLPGAAAFVSGDDGYIDGAVVTIGPEADMLETLPDYTVNHEMFHGLGFSGHYRSTISCTLMSANHCSKSYTENEEKLIDMLYNSGIPPSLDETGIKAFFQNREI